MAIEITGSVSGTADQHTEETLARTFEKAFYVAP